MYLLPCQCGKKAEVDASQAGLSVRCACGAQLAVPTMRGLSGLERIEAAPRALPSQPATAWGARQGLIFLGSIILGVAVLAAAGIWWFAMPTPISLKVNYQQEIRAEIDQHSPEDLMHLWQHLRGGVEEPAHETMITNYEAMVSHVLAWEGVIGGFGAIGLVLLIIGILQRPRTAATIRTPAAVTR
jgi:hypothetical protein